MARDGNVNRTILHIITRMDAGGAATNTITSVDRLREHGFGTALAYGVTADTTAAPVARMQALGIEKYFLPRMVRDVAPLRDLSTLRELVRTIRENRYDLVHTHCSKAGAVGRLAAMICRVPAVHTPHGHIFYGYFGHVPTSFFVIVERWLARHTRKLISLTDAETRESLERGIGRREQYVTIPSGVALATFRDIDPAAGSSFRQSLGIPADAVVAASIGRLVRIKGFDVLLESFEQAGEQYPDLHLVIAGDGEERDRLADDAARRGLSERVHFAGHLDDVRPVLSAADLFVLASRNEGMGRAIIEAMAASVPVLATRPGGLPTLIEHARTGLLVEPEDAGRLGDALVQLVESVDLRHALGSAGADSVDPAYDEQTMIDGLAAIYCEVLS